MINCSLLSYKRSNATKRKRRISSIHEKVLGLEQKEVYAGTNIEGKEWLNMNVL